MPRRPSQHVDNPIAVGRRVRAARETAGLTQKALAFPGCTTAYISRIEAGKRIPSLQILAELAKRLGVSAEFLATGSQSVQISEDPVLEAELDLRLGDVSEAKERLTELTGSDDARTRARALARLGHLSFEAGEHDLAIDQLQTALEVHPDLEQNEPAIAENLGRAYALTSRYEEAMAIFERRLRAAEEQKDFLETIRFSVLYANTLIDRGRFGHAEEVIGHALALTQQSRDPVVRARIWWTQARLHALENDPVAAERYARLALSSTQLTEHARYSAAVFQTLALLRNDQDDPEAALELLEQGLPLVLEGGNAFQQGLFFAEEARAQAKLDELDSARENADRALELFEGSSQGDAARVWAILADVHERRGDVDEAIRSQRRAAELIPLTGRYRVEIYAKLADLLRKAGRTDEALDVLTQAVALQAESVRD